MVKTMEECRTTSDSEQMAAQIGALGVQGKLVRSHAQSHLTCRNRLHSFTRQLPERWVLYSATARCLPVLGL